MKTKFTVYQNKNKVYNKLIQIEKNQLKMLKFVFFLLFSQSIATKFSYRRQEFWEKNYETCGGKEQSPIAINDKDLTKINQGEKLKWNGYKKIPLSMEIENNGHTLKLTGKWDKNNIPYLTGYPLNGEYLFQELHFHWGNNITAGSEHVINGKRYSVEMHMVHFNKKYGTFDEAKKYRHGIAVIGILFQKITSQKRESLGLNKCLQYSHYIRFPKQKITIPPFPLSSFHRLADTNNLIHYNGSLTTPPCTEGVLWIFPDVWKIKKWISQAQWNRFDCFQLSAEDTHNFRLLQPRNNRKIIYTY